MVYESNENAMIQNISKAILITFWSDEPCKGGWFIIGDKYIRRGLDEKLFKAKDENIDILEGIEKIIYSRDTK